VPVDDADPGRGSLDVAMIRVWLADEHDRIGPVVLNPAGAGSPCGAQQLVRYLVEVRVVGGHAC
jgi:hypothetical protein